MVMANALADLEALFLMASAVPPAGFAAAQSGTLPGRSNVSVVSVSVVANVFLFVKCAVKMDLWVVAVFVLVSWPAMLILRGEALLYYRSLVSTANCLCFNCIIHRGIPTMIPPHTPVYVV